MMSRRMRITRGACVLVGVLLAGGQLAMAGQQNPKYGVTVLVSKPEPLAKAKTYVWMVGNPSYDKAVDKQITAAVDRELAARGFTKLASGKGDVEVSYASVNRTDTDLKAKTNAAGALPTIAVGTLVVELRDPTSRDAQFRVRMDTPIDKSDPSKIEATVNEAVAAMFAKYPAPAPAKR